MRFWSIRRLAWICSALRVIWWPLLLFHRFVWLFWRGGEPKLCDFVLVIRWKRACIPFHEITLFESFCLFNCCTFTLVRIIQEYSRADIFDFDLFGEGFFEAIRCDWDRFLLFRQFIVHELVDLLHVLFKLVLILDRKGWVIPGSRVTLCYIVKRLLLEVFKFRFSRISDGIVEELVEVEVVLCQESDSVCL